MTTDLKPASSAIVIDQRRYLLVRRGNPPAKDLFAFPGGKGEPGETPAETALRELEEETGLRGENPRLFATYDLPGSSGGFRLSVFLVDCRDSRVIAALDDAVEVGWYSSDQLADIEVPESVAECIARLEAMQHLKTDAQI
jgi:8-oxo-dGTP diphosphatase